MFVNIFIRNLAFIIVLISIFFLDGIHFSVRINLRYRNTGVSKRFTCILLLFCFFSSFGDRFPS